MLTKDRWYWFDQNQRLEFCSPWNLPPKIPSNYLKITPYKITRFESRFGKISFRKITIIERTIFI